MPYPRQHRHTGNQNRATAPYNFVPLADRIYCPEVTEEPDHSRYMVEGRHSGTIEISIKTETWLYTRAAVTPRYAAANPEPAKAVWQPGSEYREFFHHGDQTRTPVIPGSSFRGMVRQLVEVLSDGALTTAPKAGIVYRAVGDPTRFGYFYRRRFTGPNVDARNADDCGIPIPDPHDLPQTIAYPLRIADPLDPWKQNSVHAGFLTAGRGGRHWKIIPSAERPANSGESFVHVQTTQLPAALAAYPDPSTLGHHPVWVAPAARATHDHRGGQLRLKHAVSTSPVLPIIAGATVPPGYLPAWLVLTDSLRDQQGQPNKHMHCAVFEPLGSPITVSEEMRKTYLEDERARKRQGQGRQGRLLPPSIPSTPPASPSDACFPVFYMLDAAGRLVFFGPTLFFRLPYRHNPADLVGRPPGVDLPSALFGSVVTGETEGGARSSSIVKGRVRFTDFTLAEGTPDPFVERCGGYVTPPQLLAPKPACIQNYLVQPDPTSGLRHYDDHAPGAAAPTTTLRGFKHYWHKRADGPHSIAAEGTQCWTDWASNNRAKETRTVIRPVREGVTFKGTVRFDNLTDEELGALLLALELEPTTPPGGRRLRHKLGMARKHGFGSVQVVVDGLRIISPKERHGSFFGGGNTLSAGWEDAAETARVSERALQAFLQGIARNREEGVSSASLDSFWHYPRMIELAELLKWEGAPAVALTQEISVTGAGESAQWKRRWLLPTPHAVTNPGGLNIWPAPTAAGAPPTAPAHSTQTPPTAAAPPPPLPVEDEWVGNLTWSPGNSRMEVAGPGNSKASATGEPARALFDSLGDAVKKLKKAGFVRVKARVLKDGNQATILSVTPLP